MNLLTIKKRVSLSFQSILLTNRCWWCLREKDGRDRDWKRREKIEEGKDARVWMELPSIEMRVEFGLD